MMDYLFCQINYIVQYLLYQMLRQDLYRQVDQYLYHQLQVNYRLDQLLLPYGYLKSILSIFQHLLSHFTALLKNLHFYK